MIAFFKKHAGIIIGAVYALVLRLVFNAEQLKESYSLFSVTFIWITPVIIGLIPLFFASKEQLGRLGYRMSSPVLTVIVFFTICFITRIEDLICLWVLLTPYVIGALVVGIIAGEIIMRVKNKRGTLYSLILIPFIASPIEQQFTTPLNIYSVRSEVVIDASPEQVWQNIARVKQIDAAEYKKGFFNYAGIPRPLYAELDRDSINATRIGHFEGGLKFVERVTEWKRNEMLGLDIKVVPSTIRQTVFDQHILKGDHFKFLNATYRLAKLQDGKTALTLTCSYELKTSINSYASYCGDQLLSDFQERLLDVIKKRCDGK